MTPDALPREVRIRRGSVLLAGAAVYALLVYGPLEFFWTPFLLGLAYLGAAAVGGRRGGFWATGLVLTGWGVGVLLARLDFGVSSADAYLIGVGAAALAGGLLARYDFAVDLIGVGGTALVAGCLHALAGDPVQAFVEPWLYVALLGLVGATNLALALAPRESTARSSTRPRPASTATEAAPTT
jgi:hypothetical protein